MMFLFKSIGGKTKVTRQKLKLLILRVRLNFPQSPSALRDGLFWRGGLSWRGRECSEFH